MCPPSPADLTDLDATEAAAAIRRGEITSEALVGACLARIKAREPEVQAWAHLDPAHALEQACAADAATRADGPTGPLHGVPVGIKDIIDTADFPTENGSPIFAGRRPSTDAPCVSALRRAGAVIMGKTVTTELALLTPSRTRNPHNSAHSPGGSSAGSAAAIGAHMIPVATGTQTAGSIIRPAAFCGVFGFKPTIGMIPRSGVLAQSHTLDTIGALGRSLDDVALMADVMAGFDPLDSVSYQHDGPSLLEESRQVLASAPHFAFLRTPAWESADSGMRARFEGLVATLGGSVREIALPVTGDLIAWQRIVQLAENAHYYGSLYRQSPRLLSDGLKQRLDAGLKISAQDYIAAMTGREPAYRTVVESLAGFDAILTPAAAGPAPASLETTGDPVFNGLWTYLGMPAVTLPVLEVGGLPVGVQLVAPRREDGRLLCAARWLEARARKLR